MALPNNDDLSYFSILILFLILIIPTSCGKKDFRYDYFTVKDVLSGNQIVLLNGYVVNLIGNEDNDQTREFLTNRIVEKRVRFVFDSRSPFKKVHPKSQEKSFYAYVILERGYCINSKLLKDGLSNIPMSQYYLNDSLERYKIYANITPVTPHYNSDTEPEERPKYSPEIKPKDDPYSGYIIPVDCKIELNKLKIACDYTNPVTRDFAVSQAGKASGLFNLGQVCELFSSVRSSWNYVEDPKGIEFYSKASHTVENAKFSGDCDDFAILMYSIISAIGGDSRLIFAWGPIGGHAFAEVDITNFNMKNVKSIILRKFYDYEISGINYQIDADGNKWLNLDWWAAYPGGKYMSYDQYMIFYPRQDHCSRSF